MTTVANLSSYKLLPRMFLIDDGFNKIPLGPFDPDWTVGGDITYKAGRFIDESTGEQFYNDNEYHSKPCLVFSYKHKLFGNWPILKNVGGGHFHDKYIVSTNHIKPQDVMHQADNGDIFIHANLHRDPPMHSTEDAQPFDTLYEITPHLTQEELDKLVHDIRFVTQIKDKDYKLNNKVWTLEVDNYNAHQTIAVAQAQIIGLQEGMNSLLKANASTLDKVIRLRQHSQQMLDSGIEMIEGQNYSGIPWGQIDIDSADKAAASLQTEIRILAGMTRASGTLTDAQKQVLLLQTVNIVGYDFAQKYFLNIEQRKSITANGVQNLTMSKTPTPLELLYRKAEQVENGQISTDDFYKQIKDFMDAEKSAFAKNPNSAVEELKQEFINNPQRQVAQVPVRH